MVNWIVSNKIIFDSQNFKFVLIRNQKSVPFVELKSSIVLDSEITALELPCYGNFVSKILKDKMFFFSNYIGDSQIRETPGFLREK